MFSITGHVPANKEIWILGDSFLTLAGQHLEFWKELARRNPNEALYIIQWYDVKLFAPQGTTLNAVELILSTFVQALNTRPKLPSIIVTCLGDTKFWCDNDALKFTMDTILIGLLKELKRIIQTRQRDLPQKAVGPDPELFFTKLHWKPEGAIDTVLLYPKKRRTFNRLLDTIMKPRGAKTVNLNELTTKVDPDFFLGHGALSEQGFRQVWKSLSEAIHDYNNLGYQRQVDFIQNTASSMRNTFDEVSSNDSDVGDTNIYVFIVQACIGC